MAWVAQQRDELASLIEKGPPQWPVINPSVHSYENAKAEFEREHREWCARVTGLSALVDDTAGVLKMLDAQTRRNADVIENLGVQFSRIVERLEQIERGDHNDFKYVTAELRKLRELLAERPHEHRWGHASPSWAYDHWERHQKCSVCGLERIVT